MAIDIRRVTRLAIGINTESGVERYEFDMRPWREEFPELNTFQINVTPPGGMPYKAETHMEGDYLVWPITDSDTALPGDDGMYEIEAFGPNGLHKLSPKKSLIVYERMTGDLGEAPSSIQTWVEEANAVLDDNRKAVNEAQQAAASANNAAEQANSAAEKIKTATNTSLGVVKGGPGILVKEDGSLFNANVHNLLDNSNFRNPVNQRGQTTITQNFQYFIDRWQTNNVDAARPVSITASGLKLDGSNGSATTSIFQQVSNLRDGVYTSAAKAGNSVWIVQFTLTNGVYAKTNGYNDGKGQIYISGNGEKLNINLQGFAGYSVTFEWAALYEGSYTADTLPEYQPKGYAVELAECQRYYENSYSVLGITSKNEYIGAVISGTILDCLVPFAVPKRIQPTITLHPVYPAEGWRVYNNLSYYMLGNAEPQVARDTKGFNVRGTKASDDTSTWTQGAAIPVMGHWEASADL